MNDNAAMMSSDEELKEEIREGNKTTSAIQAIDKGSVHRICSGQVVLNLATAVKELVENSVDAGATTVEVRLKEYGSEVVEVSDNGYGVEKENFEGLTLKHHTSKLRDFSDLTSVGTFGFRGEALSSLCALSKLTITTCHKNATVGAKLVYDYNGKLVSNTPYPRQMGTTVTLQNLFSTMPVRYKEFQRNLKKEFNKMMQVLSAYCLISTGVRISCTNQVGKGKKNPVVNTNGNDDIKQNISNVYGAKQAQSLVEFIQKCPDAAVCEEFGIKALPEDNLAFSIHGYISSAVHGQGRGTSDRQFFFINKRPCDYAKVSRVVNDVYHSYNRHQYPFVLLDISLDKESVDVNVTPDKRQIFLENEKLLLATIKMSLTSLLEPHSSIFSVNQAQGSLGGSLTTKFGRNMSPLKNQASPLAHAEGSPSRTPTLANLKRSFSSTFFRGSPSAEENTPKQRKLDCFVRRVSSSSSEVVDHTENQVNLQSMEDLTMSTKSDGGSSQKGSSCVSQASSKIVIRLESIDTLNAINKDSCNLPDDSLDTCVIDSKVDNLEGSDMRSEKLDTFRQSRQHGYAEQPHENADNSFTGNCIVKSPNDETPVMPGLSAVTFSNIESIIKKSKIDVLETLQSDGTNIDSLIQKESKICEDVTLKSHEQEELSVTVTRMDEAEETEKRSIKIPFSMNLLKKKFHSKAHDRDLIKSGKWCRAFRAKINPQDNKSAEEELQREITKADFKQMKILGQFNLGFIIGQLGRDLFIIDQHATDEKYNFEQLQQHTIMQNQKLIIPQRLELTAANEVILLDNLDVFRANGFEFHVEEDAVPTERVRLISMPVSKNWTFGKEDVDELIFMLSDSPHTMCRPSRIRMMFASRACRKSVMVGTALSMSQMRKLINHMGEIEQPWNCPHGRPTMRHLINLDMLPR